MDMTKDMFLESDVFEQARGNFNVALQKLIKQMLDGNVSEGSINLKVDIQLYGEYIPNLDPAVEGETRFIRKPKLEANTAQRSIFDKDFQENMAAGDTVDGKMVIEGEEYKALPMKDDTEESA